MKINGKKIANKILITIKKKLKKVRSRQKPQMAVINVGTNKESLVYIKRKQKTAKKIGVKVKLYNFNSNISYQKLAEQIHQLNNDQSINGIIIQKPLPANLATNSFNSIVKFSKDIDGFRQKSFYIPPVSLSILYILNFIYDFSVPENPLDSHLINWLKQKKILIIGRGETGGKPIAKTFQEYKIKFLMAHSQTENLINFTQKADIIISCVGKSNIVLADQIKDGVILIGVGIHRDNSKLVGDYNEKEISKKTQFFSPTPGGVGPITVACLMSNLFKAFCKQTGYSN